MLQDGFLVFDGNKSGILPPSRKGRERRVFLFDHYLVFAKEVKISENGEGSGSGFSNGTGSGGHSGHLNSHSDFLIPSNQKVKLVFKHKLLTSEIGITEHVENDESKFAIWTNASAATGGIGSSAQENKVILKASSLETKILWVKKMRDVMQESHYYSRLASVAGNMAVNGTNGSCSNVSNGSNGSGRHLTESVSTGLLLCSRCPVRSFRSNTSLVARMLYKN